jgi:hypothetical protein
MLFKNSFSTIFTALHAMAEVSSSHSLEAIRSDVKDPTFFSLLVKTMHATKRFHFSYE